MPRGASMPSLRPVVVTEVGGEANGDEESLDLIRGFWLNRLWHEVKSVRIVQLRTMQVLWTLFDCLPSTCGCDCTCHRTTCFCALRRYSAFQYSCFARFPWLFFIRLSSSALVPCKPCSLWIGFAVALASTTHHRERCLAVTSLGVCVTAPP